MAAYSNVGFDLLADALATASGTSYAALLKERVTDPLGMADTNLAPTPPQCARLMTGSGIGGPGPCVDTEATGGSGGLYSTGDDMLLWLRHQTSDPRAWRMRALAHAVYLPRQSLQAAIGFDGAGPMSGIALGWIAVAAHHRMPMILQKSGGGGGFMTYIAFAPAATWACSSRQAGWISGCTPGWWLRRMGSSRIWRRDRTPKALRQNEAVRI